MKSVSTLAVLVTIGFLSCSCQAPYLIKGAYEQVRILNSRKPIQRVLDKGDLDPTVAEKLRYANQATQFARKIGLNCKKNFRTFVELDRPYVSYLVIASKKNEIKAKKWSFPIVGSFPYIGFFSEKQAKKYKEKLESQDYDTYLRGASAYSSLGWFREPLLSSMLHGSKEELAETIFHECFHRTFFFKGNVKLNERLAVFVGHKALIHFLDDKSSREREKKIWQDQIAFSEFVKSVIALGKEHYKKEKSREEIFKEIKEYFNTELRPKLQVLGYSGFLKNLNNAKLAAFDTYFGGFDLLEKAFQSKFSGKIEEMISFFASAQKLSKKKKNKTLTELNLFEAIEN